MEYTVDLFIKEGIQKTVNNIFYWIYREILKIYKLVHYFKNEVPVSTEIKSEAQEIRRQSAEKALDVYGNAILRLAYTYLHNMSDAEDILQDTLIKYMQRTQGFKNENHEKAWILCVASNLSKNRIKYNRIRETDVLEETLVAEEREDLVFVWEAVKQLPWRYREVIHLYYQEGFQTKEISRILKRNENSVRSDLKRGREKLKTILKEAYDFE